MRSHLNTMTFSILLAATVAAAAVDPVEFVDPFIGTSGNGHTTPAAAYPFGMLQPGPDTGLEGWEHCSGYQFGDKRIKRFSQTHLSGTGGGDLCDLGILPFTGDAAPVEDGLAFDSSSEKATPGYYSVELEGGVTAEMTASEHAAMFRFRFAKGTPRVLLDPMWALGRVTGSKVRPREKGLLVGHLQRDGWVRRDVFFAVELSREPSAEEVIPTPGYGLPPRFVWTFDGAEEVLIKVSLSRSSIAGAVGNIAADMPRWDFDAAKASAESRWREMLSRVAADGPRDRLVALYTSLYHLFFQPNLISDAGEKPFYSTMSLWDTFRAAHPLYTLLCPEYVVPFVESMSRHCDKNGYMPIWTLWDSDNQCMIGTHSVPVVVDAFLKGFPGDWEAMYARVRQTLTAPHVRWKEDWDLLDIYGYYPFDVIRGESVSRTMECAYDDWCAAQMAERLGKAEDAAFFLRRSRSWRNVFDVESGYVRGKDRSGRWREPFNPFALGHGSEAENDFTEGNAFQYTWHVMQDPKGLEEAMGGRDAMLEKLDALFRAPEKIEGSDCPVDISGLIGQYVHGNEPSHHVIYFYSLLGRPDKAAERVAEVFERFYGTTRDGLCGNDDCGQMSAWYVFSALGFYPFNPCGGEYVTASPQFDRLVVRIGDRKLVVTRDAPGATDASFRGRPVEGCVLRHADVLKGGELVFSAKSK